MLIKLPDPSRDFINPERINCIKYVSRNVYVGELGEIDRLEEGCVVYLSDGETFTVYNYTPVQFIRYMAQKRQAYFDEAMREGSENGPEDQPEQQRRLRVNNTSNTSA